MKSCCKCGLMLLALLCAVLHLEAQHMVCRTGLQYALVYEGGGHIEYKVSSVAAYSPANRAGVLVGDYIVAIDGIAVADLSLDQMSQLMESGQGQYLLELRRGEMFLRLAIIPECKELSELTERELAYLFAGYSPEDVTDERLRYLYTGIIYHRDNLPTIRDIEPASPASVAGLLPGDVIKKINAIELEHRTLEELLASYDGFMTKMQAYRQDAPQEAMQFAPWFVDAYTDVARQMQRDKSDAMMSYLFAFRSYISSMPSDVLTIEVERGDATYVVELRAVLREEGGTPYKLDQKYDDEYTTAHRAVSTRAD